MKTHPHRIHLAISSIKKKQRFCFQCDEIVCAHRTDENALKKKMYMLNARLLLLCTDVYLQANLMSSFGFFFASFSTPTPNNICVYVCYTAHAKISGALKEWFLMFVFPFICNYRFLSIVVL